MKIVDRKTFLQLPLNTVFTTYEPCVFGGLNILVGAGGNDFVEQPLDSPIKCESSDDFVTQCEKAERGEDIEMDFDCAGRNGLFEDKQLFAVWSKADVQGLIDRLKQCLEGK